MITFRKNSSPLNLNAVLFDLDGTLINSIEIYFKILRRTFESLELPPISKEDMIAAASTGDFFWGRVLPGFKGEELEKLIAKCRQIIHDISPRIFKREVKLIPGALETIKEIMDRELKIGLVTSTPRALLEEKFSGLNSVGIRTLFQSIITTDDVRERKPSPEPLLECGRRLGVNPKKSVYVGDACTDVRAAKAAGMWSIGVLTGFDTYDTLIVEDPDGIMESVKDLGELLT